MSENMYNLLAIMEKLRDPETGCPWDLTQDFASIAPYTIEEAYEVAEAIAADDMAALRDELGDLLFQAVYHAQLAAERGAFDFEAVAGAIRDKMLARHPHVFGLETAIAAAERRCPGAGERIRAAHASTVDSAEAQRRHWDALKAAERGAAQSAAQGVDDDPQTAQSHLDDVPTALPALTRALKLQQRAARPGFDWPEPTRLLAKIGEEIDELRAELNRVDADTAPARAARFEEMGDLLFACAALARKLDIDPEAALRAANDKFTRRFQAMERQARAADRPLAEYALDELEGLWRAAKDAERKELYIQDEDD